MPNPRRIERLQQLILETAATTVQRDLADPRLGFVTVTHVKLAPDLSFATVYWSCLGTDAQQRTCDRALQSARTRIQSAIAGALGTRVTPQIRLAFDDTIEKASHLEEIFQRLRAERGEPEEAPASPTDIEDETDASDDAPEAPPPTLPDSKSDVKDYGPK